MTDFTPQVPAVFVGVDIGGVTHYRTMLPARALKASMLVRTADLGRMKLVGDHQAPIAIYSMPRFKEAMAECKQILSMPDRRLIIDVDDHLRAVIEDGYHPAASEWAKLVDEHEYLIAKADAVTVSTDFLADYVRRLGQSNVHVIPNALDIERWNHRREPRHKELTIIGWSGAAGHEQALKAHAPALEDLLRRRDDIAFASVGVPLSQFFPADLHHRFHDVGFVPIAKHPQVLTQFHINIGPTMPTDFYRAKSDLRAIEAMASDSYFIGGRTTYMDAVLDGGGNFYEDGSGLRGELLANHIERAIDNPKRNHDERKRAGKWVRENRLIEHVAPKWLAAIDSVR